jgi:hypothetical protein
MADLSYDPNMPRRPRPIALSPFWQGSASPGLGTFTPAPDPGMRVPTPMGWLTPGMASHMLNNLAPNRETIADALGEPMDVMAWAARKLGAKGTRYVLQSQLAYANAGHAGVKLGPARYNLVTYDGVHLDGVPCRTFGDMLAQQILALLGVPPRQSKVGSSFAHPLACPRAGYAATALAASPNTNSGC